MDSMRMLSSSQDHILAHGYLHDRSQQKAPLYTRLYNHS